MRHNVYEPSYLIICNMPKYEFRYYLKMIPVYLIQGIKYFGITNDNLIINNLSFGTHKSTHYTAH